MKAVGGLIFPQLQARKAAGGWARNLPKMNGVQGWGQYVSKDAVFRFPGFSGEPRGVKKLNEDGGVFGEPATTSSPM